MQDDDSSEARCVTLQWLQFLRCSWMPNALYRTEITFGATQKAQKEMNCEFYNVLGWWWLNLVQNGTVLLVWYTMVYCTILQQRFTH